MPTDCRTFGYTANDRWAMLPAGFGWQEVAAVATDARDRLFVFSRGEHALMVFAPDGTLLAEWDASMFVRPHGLTIGPDDEVYCTDDCGHTVRKFSPDGELLFTLGTHGQPSETGATSVDFRTITHAGPPFHYPTNLAVAPGGELYVTDGYGNARVHVFAPDGTLVGSWGEPGGGPGSSACRTGSRSTATARCSSRTARTAAFNCSPRRASSSPSGPTSRGRRRCSSPRSRTHSRSRRKRGSTRRSTRHK